MFSLKIIDTDMFLDMPITARLLYYEFNMRADDDGFVSSPKKIQKMVGCSDDDFKILMAKQFIIPFESGVCVIRHWRIHNYIRGDRYSETIYQDEKAQLVENNGSYDRQMVGTQNVIPVVDQMSYQRLPQVRLEIGKDSIGKDIYGEHVALTSEEYSKLQNELGQETLDYYIDSLNGYIEQIGKKAADKRYKSHYATIRNWYRRDKAKAPVNKTTQQNKNKFNNCESRQYEPGHGEQYIEKPTEHTTDEDIAKELQELREMRNKS